MKLNLKIVTWFVICLVAVSVQVYHISSEYFVYGITTRVELVIQKTMEVPTMSFCILTSYLFKWHNMTQQERISALHLKNETNIIAYDAINESPESLASLKSILGNTWKEASVSVGQLLSCPG